MDVITDYTRGEHIGLRRFDSNANGPAAADIPVTQVNSVALAPDPLPHVGESFRPVIGSAQYAVFHGTFAGGNTFTVNADGPDLFAVYDTRTGPDELVGKGSLVLLGVSDEQALADALTLAGAPGTDWNAYSQASVTPASAILDGTPRSPSAMDLIATPA